MNTQKLITDSILSDIQAYGDISQLGLAIQVNTNNPELYNSILKTKSNNDYNRDVSLRLVHDELGDTKWPAYCRFIGTNIKHSSANTAKSDLVYADFSNNYGLDGAIDVINNVFTYVAYIAVHKPSLDSEAQSATFYRTLEKKGLAIKHIPIDENTQVVRLINKLYTTENPVRASHWDRVARARWAEGGYNFEDFSWGDTPGRLIIEDTKNLSKLERYAAVYDSSEHGLKKLTSSEIVATAKNIFEMEKLYKSERKSIIDCFKQLDTISTTAIYEIGITREDLERQLEEKLQSLNHRFWNALFQNVFDAEGQFALKAKQIAMDQVFGRDDSALKNMPFSAENAKFFTNRLYELLDQRSSGDFIELIKCAISPMNVTPYTSNPINLDTVKWEDDEYWVTEEDREALGCCRFNKKIVSTQLFGRRVGYSEYDIRGSQVSRDINNILLDTATLAQQVGITDLDTESMGDSQASLRNRIDVLSTNGNSKNPVFSTTLYKNGKLHLTLSDEFALRLNIVFGKSKGWLSDAKQAYKELDITNMDYDTFKLIYESANLSASDFKETKIGQFLNI